MSTERKLGYCGGVGADGMTCFVREKCMRHTQPTLTSRTIDPPFTWRLADHNKWQMECPEYVADVLKPSTPATLDKCEHGIPRQFCTALHEGYDANGSPVVDAPAPLGCRHVGCTRPMPHDHTSGGPQQDTRNG